MLSICILKIWFIRKLHFTITFLFKFISTIAERTSVFSEHLIFAHSFLEACAKFHSAVGSRNIPCSCNISRGDFRNFCWPFRPAISHVLACMRGRVYIRSEKELSCWIAGSSFVSAKIFRHFHKRGLPKGRIPVSCLVLHIASYFPRPKEVYMNVVAQSHNLPIMRTGCVAHVDSRRLCTWNLRYVCQMNTEWWAGAAGGSWRPSLAKISVANFGIRERVRALSRAKLVAVESALIPKWAVESKFLALFAEEIRYAKSSSFQLFILPVYISYICCLHLQGEEMG